MTRPNRPKPKALHHTWRAFTHHQATRPRTWIARAGDRIDRLAVSYDRLITHMGETLTGETTMTRYLKPILLGVGIALVIDLGAAWLWLSFHDGPDFPY